MSTKEYQERMTHVQRKNIFTDRNLDRNLSKNAKKVNTILNL